MAFPFLLGFRGQTHLAAVVVTMLGFASSESRAERPVEESVNAVRSVDGLVAFWPFDEPTGVPRRSRGTTHPHVLSTGGGVTAEHSADGPFGGSAVLTGKEFFYIPHEETRDLNICGPEAQVSMIAWIKLAKMDRGVTVAGKWYEGQGRGDNAGSRQYSLLLNIPAYGGRDAVCPHISAEGGVTVRADGTRFPWCVDYAVTPPVVQTNRWISVGFTYDAEYVTAYYDGQLQRRAPKPDEDRRTDAYFTQHGAGYVANAPSTYTNRGVNPYYHGRGIYDPESIDYRSDLGIEVAAPADFTVGTRYVSGNLMGEPLVGNFGGLAVFDRALDADEMSFVHSAAQLEIANTPEKDAAPRDASKRPKLAAQR